MTNKKAGETVRKDKPIISDEVLCAEYSSVYHYVLSLCRDDTETQDITQEAFLKAMKASNSFEGTSSLYTWLCTISKNIWLNRCKRQNREAELNDETQCGEPSVEQLMMEKDMSMHIHRILHKLSEPYKEVFSLRVFGELAFGDIARLFSKTESWARVTYHRARKMIIEKMRKDGLL